MSDEQSRKQKIEDAIDEYLRIRELFSLANTNDSDQTKFRMCETELLLSIKRASDLTLKTVLEAREREWHPEAG